MADNQLIIDETYYLISRILALCGSILLLIGTIITFIVAYNAYKRLLAGDNILTSSSKAD